MEKSRANQNNKVEAMVVETRIMESVTKVTVGDITPAEDGEQLIETMDSRLIKIQGKDGQKDFGMNTPMETNTNLGSTEEREAFAEAVKTQLESIAKAKSTKTSELKVTQIPRRVIQVSA